MKDNYTRVTHILGAFSGLQSIPKDILQNAAERGTLVHQFIDAYIEEMPSPDVPSHIAGYIDSFKIWASNKAFVKKPDRLYCDDLMITGEIDAIYEERGHLVLVDFKTPAKESCTWKYQASAYSYLLKKSGIDIIRTEFVKLEKNGAEPRVYEYQEDMETFKKIYEVYKLFFKDKKQDVYLDYI